MSIITKCPTPNLWDQICREFEKKRRMLEDDQVSVSTTYSNYNPARHNPVFYAKAYAPVDTDFSLNVELDSAISHPSCAGYWLSELPKKLSPPPESPPDKKTCSNREYLEHYVWPYLTPALELTLTKAQEEGSFGRKRVAFRAIGFLVHFLYNHNPLHKDRGFVNMDDIPFVKAWLEDNPRPKPAESLMWTENETAIKIQRFWRGYLVRRDPEVQELRKWQEEWRIINREQHIKEEVNGFWDRVMPATSTLNQPVSTLQLNTSLSVYSRRSISNRLLLADSPASNTLSFPLTNDPMISRPDCITSQQTTSLPHGVSAPVLTADR